MQMVLLAGVPSRYLPRLKSVLTNASGQLQGWQIDYVVSNGGPDLQVRDWKQIHAVAERLGSLHVLGFSAKRNREWVAAAIRPYFRFRWFDHTLLPLLNNPDPSPFVARLISDLEEELRWALQIRPSLPSDALLLPKVSFGCATVHARMWNLAEAYGSNDSVPAAARAIAAFHRTYRQRVEIQRHTKQRWVDDRRLVFSEGGARHGTPPPPRDWKYSYRLEDGFHFDVSKLNQNTFKIADATGHTRSVSQNDYINI